jgi:methionine-rich copper-binding protein CopC
MKRKRAFASMCAAIVLAATPLLAHSEKESTSPADGAVLTNAPESIEMTFDSPMRLTMVRLTDAGGADIELQRSDGMAPVTQFQAVPAALLPGAYTVEWRGLSGDGHPMQGSFSFEIAD